MPTIHYESKSVGAWAFLVAGVLAIGGLTFIAVGGLQVISHTFIGLGLILFGLLIANFGVLTVQVTDQEVTWFFGRGPIARHIPLTEITGAESKSSPWYWGWGIRWTPNGWLWRSYGLDAVWLELTNGKKIGVGTQDPDGLTQAVRDRLNH